MNDENDAWFGLHERLETAELHDELVRRGLKDLARWSRKLTSEEITPAVVAHLSAVLARMMLILREKERERWDQALHQLSTTLRDIGHPLQELSQDIPLPPFRQLLEIVQPHAAILGSTETVRPDSPLGVSALLTGSNRSPSLVSQLQKELLSADQADWLVSFIKWSGIRPLRDSLRLFTRIPKADGAPRLRIATTSYLGATDLKAIQFLAELPNTELRISYDTHRTRLHAKAYIFYRTTGFGSAYVGSANISRVALDEGLEWTAKISQHELSYLWRQIIAAFESHWEDPSEFEPLNVTDLERLKQALDTERGISKDIPGVYTHFFDIRPFGYQQEILDEIERERRAGISKHLIIAATGTGKTMLAAFDYRRFLNQQNQAKPVSLLFVAHREEILQQSLGSFRQVLRDEGFGDLMVGGLSARQTVHIFCSVQSWHSRELDRLAPDYFDYVVLDEAHHAQAASYQAILAHLRPRVLLGLTATPERADGRDIRNDFGGRFTHELRLPDAIDRRLLAPFHYFGVPDDRSVDLQSLVWKRGRYALEELEKVFAENESRGKWVLKQLIDYISDPSQVRGLGFCVSMQHARFMASLFTDFGIPSVALTAESSRDIRRKVQHDLVRRRIQFIFTVDLYNEGVDIPEIDTILMLRPTESLTIYLQQLGRGLRLHEEKPHLTVIDFIAPQHREFRYADRFRAMSTNPRMRIDKQVEEGFSWLPSGCLIDLQQVAKDRVLENIRNNLSMRRPQVIQQLVQCRQRSQDRPGLQEMMDWLHFDDIDDLLRYGLPCRLIEAAGGEQVAGIDKLEAAIASGLRQLAAANDTEMLDAFLRWLDAERETPVEDLPDDTRKRILIAYSMLFGRSRVGDGDFRALDAFVKENTALLRDVKDVVDYRRFAIFPASGVYFSDKTGILELHAAYSRDQILLALGKGSLEHRFSHREGVLHLPDQRIDVFFVTINKADTEFSPTTMYEDYAISDMLFHWQSQSGTGPDSVTGRRYIDHRQQGYLPMLFVRPSSRLHNGMTSPFTFCGPLEYVRHDGSHPMSIVWRLEHAMPAKVFRRVQRDAS